MTDHHCPQNTTRNEVWPETGRFEHSERIAFCPYCGEKLEGRG